MLLNHHPVIPQIVIYYSLCIITLSQLSWANVAHPVPNYHSSPANQPPMPRLPPSVASNINPISTVATFSVPPQNIPTTSAPFAEYDHESISQTVATNTAVTTPTQATTLTTPTPITPSSVASIIVSRPTTTPIPLQEENVMSNVATTTTSSPDEYVLLKNTTSRDSTFFKPNKNYDEMSFMSSNIEPVQQPPSQPQDNPMSVLPDMQNFSHDIHPSSPGVSQDNKDNIAQPNSNLNNYQQNNHSITPIVLPEPPLNISQAKPQDPHSSSSNPILEMNVNQNVTVPSHNLSSDETSRPTEPSSPLQILPEGRSEPSLTQPKITSQSSNLTSNTTSNFNERKHQILKPKSRFRCTQESDCNNGTCVRGTCFCEPGFTGESCTININECLQFGSQSCLNNGTCVDEVNGFRCDCLPGFRGDRCQDLADMCNDFPCLNNAICINHRTNYTCNCEPGWDGRHCENNINDCMRNPCENEATCHDLINGYRCECPLGFMGTNCEINIDDCEKNLCQNNSTCRDLTNDYECNCRPGFSGKNCEENIDECNLMPCGQHGECTDLINSFKCKCHDGWTGETCDQDIDECERTVCLNGGSCINTEGSFKCSCKEGFAGKDCASISDICKARQPCKNGGNCKNINTQKGQLYQCQCYSGYLGTHCERRRACDPNDCNFAHAHCVSNVTCACLPGRREERTMCEYVKSCQQVDGDLCLHGGECKNLEQGGYHCLCQDPWYGPVCQFQAETQFDAILLVVITCVGFLLAACAVVSLVIFRSVRKARATRGTYSPSTQEKFGNSASDLLKPPVPERLI